MYTCVPPILKLPPTSLPNPTPLGCPRALALVALLHASSLHWSSILHLVICMFQCNSLKSSHPHLPPQSPKVCSLHLCPFCCPACFIYSSFYLLTPNSQFTPPPTPFPFDNHKFVFYVCESVSAFHFYHILDFAYK